MAPNKYPVLLAEVSMLQCLFVHVTKVVGSSNLVPRMLANRP
jgi:hypothetical protein